LYVKFFTAEETDESSVSRKPNLSDGIFSRTADPDKQLPFPNLVEPNTFQQQTGLTPSRTNNNRATIVL
jgi:hypothetical protein